MKRNGAAAVIEDNDNEFAIHKNGRSSRPLPCFFGDLFKIALSSIALFLYWQWNAGDPGVGLIFVRERQLVSANATYFVSTFGLLGSIALVAVAIEALLGCVDIQMRK
jgi:hypothetical protein